MQPLQHLGYQNLTLDSYEQLIKTFAFEISLDLVFAYRKTVNLLSYLDKKLVEHLMNSLSSGLYLDSINGHL